MHLIDIHRRIDRLYARIDLATRVLHAEREGGSNVFHHLVEVGVFLLEHRRLVVVHTHLQHLLHQEAEALRLVIDHASEMLDHLRRLRQALVVHHLRGQRDTRYRGLQFVGHVVDEVVLDLRVAFLSEDHDDGEDKRHQQDKREDDRRDHEAHTGEDVTVHLGEVDAYDAATVGRVVAKEHLTETALHPLVRVVGAAIDLSSVLGLHHKVVRDVDAVVHHLRFQVLVQQLEVDALLERFLRSGIEDIIDHLVEHALLIDVAVADDFLQALLRSRDRTAVVAQDHGLRRLRRFVGDGLHLKRRVARLAPSASPTLLRCALALLLIHVALQIAQRLVELHVARGLIQGTVDGLVKLLPLHLGHFLDVVELQQQQGQE